MAFMKPLPSQQELLEAFLYDEKTGALYWRPRGDAFKHAAKFNPRYAGTKACAAPNSKGYLTGAYRGQSVKAHRIIFKMHYGFDPPQIDHIDGNRQNNLLSNLRAADNKINGRNQRLSSKNTTGISGVILIILKNGEERYLSQITYNRKNIYLGSFKSIDEAATARRNAEKALGFGPTHGIKKQYQAPAGEAA